MKKTKFRDRVYLDSRDSGRKPYFEFDEDGRCLKSCHVDHQCSIDPFVGMSASEVLLFMKNREMEIPEDNGIERAILEYNNEFKMKTGILNCVMYKLMLRGGNRVGSRRALLFAKEFGLDIDIPVKYGIDTSDPYLLDFLFTYIKLGGNPALNCYIDCRTRLEFDYDIDICSVSQLFDLEIGEAVRYGDFQTINRIFARNQEGMDFVNNLCNQNPKKRVLEKKEETNE